VKRGTIGEARGIIAMVWEDERAHHVADSREFKQGFAMGFALT
jgi:hypothetical protein